MEFTGRFTVNTRAAFMEKRKSMRLSRYGLAKILGIESVTIKRWEEGPSVKCTEALGRIAADFIDGKLDKRIRLFSKSARMVEKNAGIEEELEKITGLYRLCRERPDLQKKMLHSLDAISESAAAKLLGKDR